MLAQRNEPKKGHPGQIQSLVANTWQARTLYALSACRTQLLGGHIDKCTNPDCKHVHISYNSCRNRHCPKCQASKQAFWVEDVSERIIDTKYFHIVFTVPEQLNVICILDSRKFYNTLFASVWQTLRTLGYTHYGTETGAIVILHTWGQNMSLHPHIHCLVPAAGITLSGNMRRISKKSKYLYPVNKLSVDFRSTMMKQLKKQLTESEQLLEYQTIIDKENVSFFYKDYRDNAKRKLTTLTGVEFLRRFSLHILPKGFVKIRYYGILINRFCKQTAIYRKTKQDRSKETVQQRLERLTGFDVYQCPYCKNGHLHIIKVLPRIRSPGNFLYPKQEMVKV